MSIHSHKRSANAGDILGEVLANVLSAKEVPEIERVQRRITEESQLLGRCDDWSFSGIVLSNDPRAIDTRVDFA
jgi:hypothetical protein